MKRLRRYIHTLQLNKDDMTARKDVGVFSGIVGILSNVILFLVKVIAGVMSGSVSVMADAVNNLSDGISSLLTVVGFYLAAKPADKEHPYGHQRYEYISGLAVSFIILYIGLEFLFTSINRVFNPQPIESSALVIGLLVVSVVVKILQGKFYSVVADELDSQTIAAVSKDSYNDVFMSASIIVSLIVESLTGWHIDGILGVIIALFILKSGVESVLESTSRLLGEPPSSELIEDMKNILDQHTEIIGYHDLFVHKYGPHNIFATVDIELSANMSLSRAHLIIDEIEHQFMDELDIHLVSHLDPVNLSDSYTRDLQDKIKTTLDDIDSRLSFHDIHISELSGVDTIQFDVVVPEEVDFSDEELKRMICERLDDYNIAHPFDITFDRNYLLEE